MLLLIENTKSRLALCLFYAPIAEGNEATETLPFVTDKNKQSLANITFLFHEFQQ